MASILGWKDILRPIRDGFRHRYPRPDTGPSPEERRQQREKDQLKGFAYFDTFDELEAWTESASDPVQRANTPLLERPQNEGLMQASKAHIMLCHDYAGNYHDYENIHNTGVDDLMYTCEHLQYVDTFVYFSHKLVCVPPPSWTNTLHRNGVKVLGSIVIEPQTLEAERLLEQVEGKDKLTFALPEKLTRIATHYGFDGWLINIEKPFPQDLWNPDIFQAFLVQLKSDLGIHKQLVWYDALTTSNEVYYQNSLNLSNLPFAQACGSLLTNYCWSYRQMIQSKRVATQEEYASRNIFFGIDVWAQNGKWYSRPRSTYKGGGTNTGAAVADLSQVRLSAGIFGPAWSYEHFPGRGREVEKTVWEGEPLPVDLTCSCGNARWQHSQDSAITYNATHFLPGTDKFFYTDMTRAFSGHSKEVAQRLFDGQKLHSRLSDQSILPLPVLRDELKQDSHLSHRLEDVEGEAKLVIDCHNGLTTLNPTNRRFKRWMPLYKLDMPANGTRKISITARNLLSSDCDGVPSIYLKFSNGSAFAFSSSTSNPQMIDFDTRRVQTRSVVISDRDSVGKAPRLEELGFYLTGYSGGEYLPVLEIMEISITMSGHSKTSPSHRIVNIHPEHRGKDENAHMRLCWSIQEKLANMAPRLEGMPYSEITGPFSHFLVDVDGLNLGRVYAMEHILSQNFIASIRGREVDVQIRGIGFDGRRLADEQAKLRIE